MSHRIPSTSILLIYCRVEEVCVEEILSKAYLSAIEGPGVPCSNIVLNSYNSLLIDLNHLICILRQRLQRVLNKQLSSVNEILISDK